MPTISVFLLLIQVFFIHRCTSSTPAHTQISSSIIVAIESLSCGALASKEFVKSFRSTLRIPGNGNVATAYVEKMLLQSNVICAWKSFCIEFGILWIRPKYFNTWMQGFSLFFTQNDTQMRRNRNLFRKAECKKRRIFKQLENNWKKFRWMR